LKVDLHIHTCASDGTWTPAEVVEEVRKNGIQLFAVTDHDTLDSIAETRLLIAETELFFLPGVEISSTYQGDLYHILAYGVDTNNPRLRELLDTNTRLMNKKDDESIRMLLEQGYKVDFEKYLQYEYDRRKGGWKALNYLVDTGVCKDTAEFFNSLFTELNNLSFPTFASPEEVFAIIEEAGGISVIAHPGLNLYGKYQPEELLRIFVQLGLQGVEAFHPQHDVKMSRICYEFAEKQGLQITSGSDCHGGFVPYRRLGLPATRLHQLKIDKILQKMDWEFLKKP
jgi:predicted metal-dependent phosphoesterase TrpH